MKKIYLILIFVLFLTSITYSQSNYTNYWRNTFWGRIVLSDKISKKLKWEIYLQKRTQNDPGELNIFKHDQLTSYWLWLHYQVSKDLRVSVTPFCYFNTKLLFPQPPEMGNRGIKEYRWAVQAEQTQKLKYFQFANRYSAEYRYRDLKEAGVFAPNWRIRYRARIEKPLRKEGKQFNLIFYDEVFLEFGRGIYGSPAIFNQNRLYAGFSYEILKNVNSTWDICIWFRKDRRAKLLITQMSSGVFSHLIICSANSLKRKKKQKKLKSNCHTTRTNR